MIVKDLSSLKSTVVNEDTTAYSPHTRHKDIIVIIQNNKDHGIIAHSSSNNLT
jgi:hypothetical protein